MGDSILKIENLQVDFYNSERTVSAIEDLNLEIKSGETVGLVGESGCGKSTTSLAIMGLLPEQNSNVPKGRIEFLGSDLLQFSEDDMRKVRGKDIAMIFQDPMTSLNPVYTIGMQLTEGPMVHLDLNYKEAYEVALTNLKKVNIPRPESIMESYPHELSGGMRQRVMIAMALGCSPKLLIADEPTTALDVTVQAQILNLMNDLQKRENMSIILITHDLGVVAEMCETVYVMYSGQVVEKADIDTILDKPQHPYTEGLLASMPENSAKNAKLQCISGSVPIIGSILKGCRFAERCPYKTDKCSAENPPVVEIEPNHLVRCFRAGKEL